MAAIAKASFVCLLACLTVNCLEVKVEHLNLNLVDKRFDMSDDLKEIKKVLSPILANTTVIEVTDVIPIVGTVITDVVNAPLEAFIKIRWESSFIKAIKESKDRKITQDEVTKLRLLLQTIQPRFKLMKNPNLNISEIHYTVKEIRKRIRYILPVFRNPLTILRKYPELVLLPLTLVTQLIAVYQVFAVRVTPKISALSLPCRMLDLLTDYRLKYVFKRVTNLSIKERGLTSQNQIYEVLNLPRKEEVYEVLNQNLKPWGYNGDRETRNSCSPIDCALNNFTGFALIDNGNCYFISENRSDNACIIEYMSALRLAIEQKFYESIDVMNDFCPDNIQSKRQPTGFGWLTITLLDAYTELLPNGTENGTENGTYCDPFDPSNTCNLFINVKVNGSSAYSTEVHTGERVYFVEMYTTVRIFETSAITLQLWSKDHLLSSGDDSLVSWVGDVKSLQVRGIIRQGYGGNSLSFIPEWNAEYYDEL